MAHFSFHSLLCSETKGERNDHSLGNISDEDPQTAVQMWLLTLQPIIPEVFLWLCDLQVFALPSTYGQIRLLVLQYIDPQMLLLPCHLQVFPLPSTQMQLLILQSIDRYYGRVISKYSLCRRPRCGFISYNPLTHKCCYGRVIRKFAICRRG